MKTLIFFQILLAVSFTSFGQIHNWTIMPSGNPPLTDGDNVVSDDDGNAYYLGRFDGTLDFDPSSNVYNLVSGPPSTTNIFLSKVDPNGNLKWAYNLGVLHINGLEIDDSANIYLAGTFYDDTVDFDPGPGVLKNASNKTAIFISKIDSSGSLVNVAFIKNSAFSGSFGYTTYFDIDDDNNVSVTGYFKGLVNFDPDTGSALLNRPNEQHIFLLKLDAQFNLKFVKSFGNADDNHALGIKFTPDGGIVAAGYFSDTIDFDPGPGIYNLVPFGDYDCYIMKVDSVGNFEWAGKYGSTSVVYGLHEHIYDLEVDNRGNIYLTGFVKYYVDFDPGPAMHIINDGSVKSGYVLKLNELGQFQWVHKNVTPQGAHATAIQMLNNHNILYSGTFGGAIDLDPGPSVASLSIPPSHGFGTFLCELDTNGNFIGYNGIIPTGSTRSFIVISELNYNGLHGIFITGKVQGSVNYSPLSASPTIVTNQVFGSETPFLAKYSYNVVGAYDEKVSNSMFNVFPNPSDGMLYFDNPQVLESVLVYSIDGKLVNSVDILNQNWIELPKLSGIYLMRFKTKDGNIINRKVLRY